jgi:16S rRNA processing protein RimM
VTPGDWVAVGRVGRPHGIAGAFFVELASEAPGRLSVGAVLHVDGEPASVVEAKRAGGRPVIRLDREVRRGADLCVRREELPAPDEGSYYVFQLVGLLAREEGGGELGLVQDVEPGVANDVLVLDSGHRLPLVDACILEIDLADGVIVVAPGFSGGG